MESSKYFLAILGILGVNAIPSILKHQEKIKRFMGWFLVILGAIIFIVGGAHGWYEETIVNTGWNTFIEFTNLPAELMGGKHEHEGAKDFIPEIIAPWLLVALIAVPIIWHYIKKRKKQDAEEDSKIIKDPICGMKVNTKKASQIKYKSKTYYFCSPSCREAFRSNPGKYIKK